MNELRSSILDQQQKIASKSRFGLFTQPPPLAVGDDGPYKTRQHPRGQNGKPITEAKNMMPGPSRSGTGKKGYFQVPESIHQGDIYKDTFKVQIQYERKMHSKSNFHQTEFKPSSMHRTLAKSSYQYVQEKDFKVKTRIIDDNGRVRTQPKNITSNPMTKVEREFMKNPEYIPDPVERKKQQQRKQRQIFNSKLPEASWKFAKSSIGAFGKIKQVYGENDQTKRVLSQKKQPKKTVFNTVAHEAPFVPTKRPSTGPIGKYPRAMSWQSLQELRPRAITSTKQGQSWRPSNYAKSRPTPSISLLKKNLISFRYK